MVKSRKLYSLPIPPLELPHALSFGIRASTPRFQERLNHLGVKMTTSNIAIV